MSDLSWLNPTPHAIAVYASRPLSPVATQHSLPSGRYSLLGPDFHRLDRASFAWRTHSITSWRLDPCCGSTVWWKNDAEQHPFVGTCLPGSADMSTTVRRDHVVDLVVGNWRPFAVHLDFVMVADRSTLRWTTVQEVTASAFPVVSVELQIEVLMPPFMADPVISLLRRCAGTKEDGSEADYRYPSLNMRDHGGPPSTGKQPPTLIGPLATIRRPGLTLMMARTWNPGMTCQICRPCTHTSLDKRGMIKCRLWPPLRTQVGHYARAEKCQEATYAVRQVSAAFGSCLAIAVPRQAHCKPRAFARFARAARPCPVIPTNRRPSYNPLIRPASISSRLKRRASAPRLQR